MKSIRLITVMLLVNLWACGQNTVKMEKMEPQAPPEPDVVGGISGTGNQTDCNEEEEGKKPCE